MMDVFFGDVTEVSLMKLTRGITIAWMRTQKEEIITWIWLE